MAMFICMLCVWFGVHFYNEHDLAFYLFSISLHFWLYSLTAKGILHQGIFLITNSLLCCAWFSVHAYVGCGLVFFF